MPKKSWNLRKSGKLRRNLNTRDIRKKFLIMTEGETEAVYFNHYKQAPNPVVLVIDKSDNKTSLVQKAIDEKKKRISENDFIDDIDEAWVVLDRDVSTNKGDKANFNNALQIAKNNGVHVAYSNDSFELWFLMHFQDVSSAMHRDIVCSKLNGRLGKKHVKGGSGDLYELIKPSRSIALKRAARVLKQSSGTAPEAANPSTTVHILVNRIMDHSGFRDDN
jgi:hypothetical protein